jgi:hypothetical protein
MKKLTQSIKTKVTFAKTVVLTLVLAMLPLAGVTPAAAAQITNRKVTLGSSAPSPTTTTYTFNFTVPTTGTVIKSASFTACTTPSGTCSSVAGFSNTGVTLTQPTNLGDASGWTVDNTTAGSLRLNKSGDTATPTGNQTVVFNGVTNPSTTNTTFFLRMTTYSDAAYTTAIDSGVVAASTATQVQVSLAVDEALTFCTGTSITGTNCATATGSTVNLGTGSTTATSSGTSILAASTNGTTGYSITVSGSTLTSGSNTITALSSGAASSVGTKQFGLNLVANTTPAVGSAVNGSGSGTAATNYATANTFRFGTGETVASVGAATNANTYTVSYIANIDGLTPPGSYTTTLTYVATPNF